MRTRKRLGLATVAALAATAGAALSTAQPAVASDGRTYWDDEISRCEDPCPGLASSTDCRCVKMDPIIIIAT